MKFRKAKSRLPDLFLKKEESTLLYHEKINELEAKRDRRDYIRSRTRDRRDYSRLRRYPVRKAEEEKEHSNLSMSVRDDPIGGQQRLEDNLSVSVKTPTKNVWEWDSHELSMINKPRKDVENSSDLFSQRESDFDPSEKPEEE